MASPKLRFKAFDGDWTKICIGDHSETVTSGSRDWAQYYSDSGDEFIRMTNLVRDGIYLDLSDLRYVKLPNDSNEGKRTSLVAGDILISITAELGKLGWIPTGLGTAYINQHTALVRMKKENDSKFVAYSLSTDKYNNKLNSLNDSGAKAGLNLGTIRNFELMLPSKEEQTQIASFLSAVDEKIAQLTQKHELLSQYKQGMMQRLFSQQIRFKADDGSEFGEWINRKIIEIAEYVDYRGKTPKKVESGILLVTAKNIRFGYIDYEVSREYIGAEDFDEVMRRGQAKIGDILITTEAPLGNVASVDRENIALAQRVIKYRGKKDILDNGFLKQKFLSEDFQALIASKATGGTVQGIKGSTLHNLEIDIPQDLNEQTKIANFLSAIDQKIEVVTQQIEQAKQWKKGLLQQMFV